MRKTTWIPLALILIFFLLFVATGSQTTAATTAPVDRLSKNIQSALDYVRLQQTHLSGGYDGYEFGQWRGQVTSTSLPSHVGVGESGVPYEEPSAFVASSVANVLAEMYFLNPSQPRNAVIPPMIEKAAVGLYNYRSGPAFYFYPPKVYHEFLVRGPRFMFLNPRWFGFTNIPRDADTSSNSFLMLGYRRAMLRNSSPLNAKFELSDETIQLFSTFRDVNRNPHLWNQAHGNSDTGGYLTWLFDEKDPNMPHDYFARPDKGTRIPFNKNDVDCIVNTNVLKMLTISHREQTPGFDTTCGYLNEIVRHEQFFTCGMYYPSDFILPYDIASAIQLGVQCLDPSQSRLVAYVLRTQEQDGSWQNHRVVARPDAVQSTAWALNTLLLLGDPKSPAQRAAAQRGVDFLIAHATIGASPGISGLEYWPGEVFYAAIFLARKPVVWRSTAYTTATVARALDLAEQKWHLR